MFCSSGASASSRSYHVVAYPCTLLPAQYLYVSSSLVITDNAGQIFNELSIGSDDS